MTSKSAISAASVSHFCARSAPFCVPSRSSDGRSSLASVYAAFAFPKRILHALKLHTRSRWVSIVTGGAEIECSTVAAGGVAAAVSWMNASTRASFAFFSAVVSSYNSSSGAAPSVATSDFLATASSSVKSASKALDASLRSFASPTSGSEGAREEMSISLLSVIMQPILCARSPESALCGNLCLFTKSW